MSVVMEYEIISKHLSQSLGSDLWKGMGGGGEGQLESTVIFPLEQSEMVAPERFTKENLMGIVEGVNCSVFPKETYKNLSYQCQVCLSLGGKCCKKKTAREVGLQQRQDGDCSGFWCSVSYGCR